MSNSFKPYPKQGPKLKKEKKPLRRTAIKKKFKVTAEGETFSIVMDNLGDEPAKCFVCGLPLSYIDHNNYAHILSKKQWPLFRNEPENIRLMCHSPIARINEITGLPTNGCHSDWDTKPRSKLTHEIWDRVKDLEKELKEWYKKVLYESL